jgi:hypothetical protein
VGFERDGEGGFLPMQVENVDWMSSGLMGVIVVDDITALDVVRMN